MASLSCTLPPVPEALDKNSSDDKQSQKEPIADKSFEFSILEARKNLKQKSLFFSGVDHIHQNWSASRRLLGHVLASPVFICIMGFFILCWTMVSIVETDLQASAQDIPMWLHSLEISFLAIFTVELSARFYVLHREFFHKTFNVIDLVVVSIDISVRVVSLAFTDEESMPSASVLRLFRLLQFFRVSKFMMSHRKLYMMLEGLISAVKASLWAMILILLLLLIWGIAAVELLHPIAQDIIAEDSFDATKNMRFQHAFESVWSSCLILWEIVIMGGAWDVVARPIIDYRPWAFFFFSGVVATVQLGLMNLVLTVIVDQAAAAREADVKGQAAEKYEAMVEAKCKLSEICKKLDKDGNGNISFPELKRGAVESEDFAEILQVMDIDEEDIVVLFQILDTDKSGEVGYGEFTEQLFKMKTQQEQTVLAFIKYQLSQVRDDIKEELTLLKEDSAMLNEELQLFKGLMDSNSQLHSKINAVLRESKAGVAAMYSTQASYGLEASANSKPACDKSSPHASSVSGLVDQEPMHQLSRSLEKVQQTFVIELGVSTDHLFQQLHERVRSLLGAVEPAEPVPECEAKVQTCDDAPSNSHPGKNQSHGGLSYPVSALSINFQSPPILSNDMYDSSNLLGHARSQLAANKSTKPALRL